MKTFGVQWRRPGFWQFTSASILAIGLWACLGGVAARVDGSLLRGDYASLLAMIWWPLVAVQIGADPRSGRPAAGVHALGCALLVGLAQLAL